MDSNCVRLESNTVKAEGEVVKNLDDVVVTRRAYTLCWVDIQSVAELKWHTAAVSPSAPDDDDDESSLYVSFCSNMKTHDLPLQSDTSN
jgi:hypothetical protein